MSKITKNHPKKSDAAGKQPASGIAGFPAVKTDTMLYAALFLSGASGLIYQIVWSKYLTLVFGNTVYAYTLLLSVFMGGLALGSYLFGKTADIVKNKLLWAARLQIAVAVFCLLTPLLFDFARPAYISILRAFSLGSFAGTALRFLIGSAILLPPTILMGGSIPLIGKHMINEISQSGRIVARLYYANSFGAVIGIFLAGFYLIMRFGLERSIFIAVLISLSAGFLIYTADRTAQNNKAKTRDDPAAPKALETTDAEKPYSDKIIAAALICIFFSGFTAMVYEVSWTRLLSMVLGTSTYSFSLMLAGFISGITLGAWLVSKYMPKSKNVFLFFGICEMLIGVSLILTLPFYEKLPFIFMKLAGILNVSEGSFVFFACIKFLIIIILMLPPTVLFGITLPLAGRIAMKTADSTGRRIGGVFAIDTAGNIAGALFCGLLLLPLLGIKGSIELGIAVNLILGIVIIILAPSMAASRKISAITACFVIFTIYKTATSDWQKGYFSAQLFRGAHKVAHTSYKQFKSVVEDADILFYKDGADATVAVIGGPGGLRLFINGKADAGLAGDMAAQILTAQLPLILKSDAQDVLVVGLGSGVTGGSALLHPIKNLDMVEISQSVVEASRYFSHANYNVLENERMRLYVEDAKTFLQRNSRKYDIIINEPSNPWISGIGALFTVEYYRDCLARLEDGGWMVQWLQSYETNREIFEIVVRTFGSVFPEVTMWSCGDNDIVLIGTTAPIAVDFAEAFKKVSSEAVKNDLGRIGMEDLFTLLSNQTASSGNISGIIPKIGPVNKDYFPVLEYLAPKALYAYKDIHEFISSFDERRVSLSNGDLIIKEYLPKHPVNRKNLENLFNYISRNSPSSGGFSGILLNSIAHRLYNDYPSHPESQAIYNTLNIGAINNELASLRKDALSGKKHDSLDRYAAAVVDTHLFLHSFLTPDIIKDTVEKLLECVSLTGNTKSKYYYVIGNIYMRDRNPEEALKYYLKAEELISSGLEDIKNTLGNYSLLLKDIAFAYDLTKDAEKSAAYKKKIADINR